MWRSNLPRLVKRAPNINGPLTRYVKLWVAHAPGMPVTFSPATDFKKKLLVSDPGMHRGTCLYEPLRPYSIDAALTFTNEVKWHRTIQHLRYRNTESALPYRVYFPYWNPQFHTNDGVMTWKHYLVFMLLLTEIPCSPVDSLGRGQ